jgi:4-hydroxy-3-methylbut-2-enyl diphosphate reductase
MEIVLAESLGFCMGVKRAVDLAYKALEKAGGMPVTSLGPLIHNSQEIARMTGDGLAMADSTDLASLPAQGTVIIRAHGVTPQAYDELKARGLRVMDGTCPYVHYSQRKARELYEEGYTVVIAGDRNHAEIVGILGGINNEGYAVKSVDEAEALPALARIGVIAQTTISPKKFQTIIDVLKTKALEVKVCETICDATEENQKAIRELAGQVELLYVIGGRHSANSNKLVEVGREKCMRTLLIETPEEIDSRDLQGVMKVGVSAGASTPDWMIQKVVQHLRMLERTAQAVG